MITRYTSNQAPIELTAPPDKVDYNDGAMTVMSILGLIVVIMVFSAIVVNLS